MQGLGHLMAQIRGVKVGTDGFVQFITGQAIDIGADRGGDKEIVFTRQGCN
jgi:hypothetical protein